MQYYLESEGASLVKGYPIMVILSNHVSILAIILELSYHG